VGSAVSGWRARASVGASGDAQVSVWLLDLFNAPEYRPPVLPRASLQLLALAKNSNVRIAEIARVLEQDQMLTAMVLRIANSAIHRAGRDVTTIEDAINRIGLRRMTEIVLEAAVTSRVFRAPGYDKAMDQLREHSLATAHVARMLSRYGGVDPSEAFVCGLLHDIGVAAALIAVSDHFGASPPPPLELIWPAIMQQHAASGALLQQSWGLPNDLGRVLSHHHEPNHTGAPRALLAVVSLADALVSELGVGLLDEVSDNALGAAQDALGLDQGLLNRARGSAQSLVDRLER
jgi:putative nucleotidyltransferase with HDIG domain